MYAGQRYKGSDNYGRGVELRRLHSDLIRYYKKSSAVAEMGDRARAKWAEKWGLMCLFPWGGAGSPSNTMLPGRGLPPYQVAS